MKLLRTSASLAALILISVLAACGGGGGGGGTTNPPVTNPGGGGGGGSTPTPAPTSTPAPGQSSTPGPTPTPTPTPSGVVVQGEGHTLVYDGTQASPLVFGKDPWQTSGVSDSAHPSDGDVAGGYVAMNGGPINGVNCTLGTEPGTGQYHVHAFVGIFVNGVQYALPDEIGMIGGGGDEGGSGQYPNLTFSQACSMHTHGTSGIVHIEDKTLPGSFTATYPQYNLQSLLDIWGYQSIDAVAAAAANGFAGPVSIYVGTPCPNNTVGCAHPNLGPGGADEVSSFTLVTGSPSSIVLGHHMAIWIVVGNLPASGLLPAIDFGIQS